MLIFKGVFLKHRLELKIEELNVMVESRREQKALCFIRTTEIAPYKETF